MHRVEELFATGPRGELLLSAWHAEPLEAEAAGHCLLELRRNTLAARFPALPGPDSEVMEMILSFWMGRSLESFRERLLKLAENERRQALVELVYGQLLLSRRTLGAWTHLDRGLQLASSLLAPSDYFVILRRHQALRDLPLNAEPLPPQPLERLLREAAVARRLKGGSEPPPARRQDTVG